MSYYNKKKKELNDNAILKALDGAKDDYENGAILECQGTLIDIIDAINEFTENYEG